MEIQGKRILIYLTTSLVLALAPVPSTRDELLPPLSDRILSLALLRIRICDPVIQFLYKLL
jgi:hypothetical protein